MLRQPGGNQPRVQPSVQCSVPSVEGTNSQVTHGVGTDQSGNNELLRRSERNVARPVKYSK